MERRIYCQSINLKNQQVIGKPPGVGPHLWYFPHGIFSFTLCNTQGMISSKDFTLVHELNLCSVNSFSFSIHFFPSLFLKSRVWIANIDELLKGKEWEREDNH